jgi:hypothetical protein
LIRWTSGAGPRFPDDLAEGKIADDLYAALKPEIREQLSRLEFADFLDSCRRARLLDESAGGILESGPPTRPNSRIAIK